MASLSDKLKSLGVNIGAEGISSPTRKSKYPIEKVVDGRELNTPNGQTFLIEKTYPVDPRDELLPLSHNQTMSTLAEWLHEPGITNYPPESFAFLDTETSGLAGGTGTYAFLIGIGKFSSQGFHLSQFFLREPIEEPAQLTAVLSFLSDCKVLVTYNGKSFDVPLLNTRYIANGDLPPFKSIAHIDLLHIVRRLWRDRLNSRTLGSIEENILGANRTEEDIPGWMVPSIYFEYLKTGDARQVGSVLYHNAMDILSLATLLNHVSDILENPYQGHAIDLIAIGRMYEEMGKLDQAAECFQKSLESDLPQDLRNQALLHWSFMEKRRQNIELSMKLWQTAAEYEQVYAYVELAKVYEHRLRDFSHAIYWTEQAIALIQSQEKSHLDRAVWGPRLDHRLSRLQRKNSDPDED